jgi:RNA polymerase sigma-70 factor (ECF subfamily)
MTNRCARGVFINMNAMSDEIPGRTGERGSGRSWGEMFLDLAKGRSAALEEIYEATASKIFGLALWRTGSREDACDVVQEVFVRLVEQGDRLHRVRNPRAWILAVAHRVAVDATRRRRKSEPLESCQFLESTPGDADRELDAEKACSLLAGLPPAQREVVYLRHFADCTFAEIGRVTGVPTFTAASRYRLGISKLRELMEGER